MIVVTTPTGKIGSQVIPHLLAANQSVRVVVRDASRLAPEVRENVDVVTGSLGDTATMEKALKGAESVFLVVPPSFSDNNDAEYYLRFTRPALHAIKSQGVKRVVDVSVLDAEQNLPKRQGRLQPLWPRMKQSSRAGLITALYGVRP